MIGHASCSDEGIQSMHPREDVTRLSNLSELRCSPNSKCHTHFLLSPLCYNPGLRRWLAVLDVWDVVEWRSWITSSVPSSYTNTAKMGVSTYNNRAYSTQLTSHSESSEPRESLVESSEPTPISTRTQPSSGTWISQRRTVTLGVSLGRSFTILDGGSF
jgi:hypothetical protein